MLKHKCCKKRSHDLTRHEKGPEDTVEGTFVFISRYSRDVAALSHPEDRCTETINCRRDYDNGSYQ